MPYNIVHGGDCVNVQLSGEIDHHTAKEMRSSIDYAASHAKPRTLILDFGGVSFMDSSGIGLIMGRCRLMNTLDGTVKVCNVPPNIAKVVKLAGLDKLVKIEYTEVKNSGKSI